MAKTLLLICYLLFAGFFQLQAQRVPVEKLKVLLPKNISTPPARPTQTRNSAISRMDIAPGCDSIFINSQDDIDNFAVNHPDCDTIRQLVIDGQGASPAITDLNGLNTIIAVTENIFIHRTSITTLAGMTGLRSIGGSLRVEENNQLSAIGLNNLELLGRIIFRKLPALNDISGLSNNISSTGAVVIEETGLTSLQGLENITDLTEFDGVTISNTPIANLEGLANLRIVRGYVKLDNLPVATHIGFQQLEEVYGFLFAGMPNLTSIAGISDHLTNTNIGTFWMISTGLSTLEGMNRVTSSSNFYVWFNPNLTTLQGLNSLSGNIGGGVYISGNGLLTNISAISNISSVQDGTLELNGNNSLTDASPLSNIIEIGGGLSIQDNPLLSSLNFLNNSLVIRNNNDDQLKIRSNPQLAVCGFAPICNYLQSGLPAVIEDNAPGCNSIAEIILACSNCVGGTLKRWTGSENSEWSNPNNWLDTGVPAPCDTVLIPEGLFYYPVASGHISINGLIMESNTSLDMQDFDLLSKGTLQLNNAQIYNSGGSGTVRFLFGENPRIEYSSITGQNIYIKDYTGELNLEANNFYGNVFIEDHVDRTGENIFNSNQFHNNLSITTKGTSSTAVTRMSQSGDDNVYGNLTLAITQPVNFWVGAGNTLHLEGDFILQTDINPDYLFFGFIDLINGTWSHITQTGTTPITIRYLSVSKNIGSRVTLNQPVYIQNDLRFSTGLIKTTQQNLLVLLDDAGVSQTSSASWVSGPVKKIGNEQFTFPVGNDQHQAILTILSPSSPTDAYTVEYFYNNPTGAGYDTALHVGSLSRISGKEYWMLTKDPGSSDVFAGLSYDSTRSDKTGSLYSLRTTQWDGSRWVNKGSIFLSGNLAEAYLTSGEAITSYDKPLTLAYIEPPIIPVITLGPMDTVACVGAPIKVRFSLDTLMYGGNNFSIQLSDSSGSFANPVTLATLFDKTNSDSVTVYIPFGTKTSELYRIRVVGSSPPVISVNTRPLAIRVAPTLAFTILGPQPGCIGTGVHKYYVSQKENGANYNWALSGGGTFTVDKDTIYITWTTPGSHTVSVNSFNICGTGPAANKQVSVSNPAPNAIPELNKTGRWLYASTPDAAQHALGYHWYRNDVLITGANNASYYATIAGTYKVAFYNACGDGPSSTVHVYGGDAITQSINFPSVTNRTYGDSAFILNTSASSGFPVSLSIVSGPGTLSGNTYVITGTGTVIIKATQLGDDVYDTAAHVFQSFVINKATQTINFPVVGDKAPGIPAFGLNANSTSGLPVSYSIVSGPATILANQLTVTGLGNVTINATQAGDTNYLPATLVSQSFCVRVSELAAISGPLFACPGQTATYKINKVSGLTYSWRLANGTVYASTSDSVVITWPASGSYTLIVSATGPCGIASANDSLVVNVVTAVTPGAVSNMLPGNGSNGQQLPLNLSWSPGTNALSYDIYIWDSVLSQPLTPYASNITGISYQIPSNAFPYNKSYKWRIVSRNACLTTDGPVQSFRLRPLPDLMVSNVQLPNTAVSGETISFSWRVTNNGPGSTTTNQSWSDAVFLSFDTIPNFSIPPNTGSAAWNQLQFPVRPLLVATRPNVSALDSGQHYDNTVNFSIPANYAQPLYLYVITNYPDNPNAPLQMSTGNDTAHASHPVNISLAPTPDLRVDTVLAPASVFSGSTVNITYKVKNYGVLTPPGQTWTDKIYISQNQTFSLNTATLLNVPKANDSYYPNAVPAGFNQTAQLQGDSSYTKSVQVVIPNFITGSYFIHVVTNQQGSLYEGILANNNSQAALVQVFLTPTPLLTINSINVPVSQASITQPIGVSWIVRNTGFSDNREKNKGHYYLANGNCTAGQINLIDSIGFGSSYWVDRVYLSTDAGGLTANAILVGSFTQGTENSGMGSDLAPTNKCVPPGAAPGSYNENTSNVIGVSSTHPGQLNFTIPDHLAGGSYYVYIVPNATKTVFEYPGVPQVKRSDLPILVQRPDVSISSITAPASATGGQALTIQYTVLNNGAGALFSHQRKDRLFVSSSPVFDASATLVATESFTEAIPVGGSVTHSMSYTFDASTGGNRYFYIQANYDSSFRESNYINNISSHLVTVSAATPVDWVVSSVNTADSVTTAFPSSLKYTVNNNGVGKAIGTWIDSIFISCQPVFHYSTAFPIGRRTQSRTINSGDGYTDSVTMTIPLSWLINNCFPKQANSPVYFFVKTNTTNTIYEGLNNNNNISGSGARVLVNPLVDHIVTSVNGFDTAIVARPYTVSWSVKNIGAQAPASSYLSWYDGIYFSTDSIFSNSAILADRFFESGPLANGQTLLETKSIIVPNLGSGEYYLIARSNDYNQIPSELNINNNTNLLRDAIGNPRKVYVVQPLLPDLIDSILSAPTLLPVGQPLTIVHRVKNTGIGDTYPNSWSNGLWLSQDFIPNNAGDILLSSRTASGILQPGQSRLDTVTATLPLTVPPGNYILISKADAGNTVAETNDTNNLSFIPVTVYAPAPSDLIVENIVKPDTVVLGYPMSNLQWEVVNNSPNNATGFSADGIYFSKNTVLDSTAVLMGVLNKNINIAPLTRKSESHQPMVNAVVEGNYHVIVRTDLLNNIIETNKSNNSSVSSTRVFVKVNELMLNVTAQNTLESAARYYKLVIPDSLKGSTVQVALQTGDSLTVRNEMFIGAGYIPTPAGYDYRFDTPNYGNQQIVISSVEDTVYYIMIRCASPSSVVQNITLKAVTLPFAVLMVQSNSGGNSGNVTVKISGSLFVPGMSARLVNSNATVYSSAIYYSNSTSVYATFNLKGRPLGLYDLVLLKADSSVAVKQNSFNIVAPNSGGISGAINTGSNGNGNEPGCDPGAPAGLNSLLLTEIVIPKKVFAGWPFVIQVNFSNPTNNDLPAQVRIIYNDYGVPIAASVAELTTAKTSMYLELTEPGGPPGIIRAGATGTILLHAKAPQATPGHTIINFTIK